MKKVFNILLTVTALLGFAQVAQAQYTIENGIGVRKTISTPDIYGVYTITLESFVEGEVKITPKTIPADIVLVLDISSSMTNNRVTGTQEEYVADNFITHGWTYNDVGDNHYIEYPYGSGQYQHVLRTGSGNNDRRLHFVYNNETYYLTGNGASDNNGTGITGGTWNNGSNYGGSIAKANEGTYNYGNSITTATPGGRGANQVIWRGQLYTRTNSFTRLHALKNAVGTFLQIVHDKDVEDPNNPLGNRISIVKFSGIYHNAPDGENALTPGNHYDDGNTGGPTEVFQGWTNTADQTVIDNLIKDVNHIATGHGTSQDFGLVLAEKLLASLPASEEPRSKTVVLFTDGEPWRNSSEMGQYYERDSDNIANAAIQKAYDIKHTVAFTDETPQGETVDHFITVFSVGMLGTNPGQQALDVVNYCSSKYPDAHSRTNHGDAVAGDYAFRAETADELDKVFEAIAASSSSGQSSLNDKAVTTVDIVSKSFMLPQGTSTEIKVYTADCNGGSYVGTGDDAVFVPTFGAETQNTALESTVIIKQSTGSGKYDEVDVVGFDYTENFCGPVRDEDDKIIDYVGKKLIVKIPVKMDPDALGGPNVPTNAPGSGIFADGIEEPVATFESPHVSLPYNLHITKTGLQYGESARFKIWKIVVQDSWITTLEDETQVITVPDEAEWTPLTTVMVTESRVPKEDGTVEGDNPGIWVRGLASTENVGTAQKIVLYKVSEESWSWSYDQNTDPQITDNSKIDNPFNFDNSKKADIKIKVRHAESKVRNIFRLESEGGGVEWMDSKTNKRD